MRDQRKLFLSLLPRSLEIHLARHLVDKEDCYCQITFKPVKCDKTVQIGHHMQELYRLGLFPSTRISNLSIENVAHRLLKYRSWVPDGVAETCCSIDIKETLERMSAAYMHKKGFCLNCVRKGKFTPSDGHCSLPVKVSSLRSYSKLDILRLYSVARYRAISGDRGIRGRCSPPFPLYYLNYTREQAVHDARCLTSITVCTPD